MRAGPRRCSASRTSSGSGTRSATPSGSTSRIRSPPGATHLDRLQERATALNERRFDHLRYRGPGTDLTIGLHPERDLAGGARPLERDRSRREHAHRRGLHHTRRAPHRGNGSLDAAAPDSGEHRPRARGDASRTAARSTSAPRPAKTSCGRTSRPTTAPSGSARSRSSTAAPPSVRPGSTFYDTLFDENASSHIAFGASIVQAVPWAAELSARGALGARRQPLVDPHRLHDRLERARGGRRHRRRRVRPASPRRGLATLSRRSGRSDSNRRLLPPKGSALPG